MKILLTFLLLYSCARVKVKSTYLPPHEAIKNRTHETKDLMTYMPTFHPPFPLLCFVALEAEGNRFSSEDDLIKALMAEANNKVHYLMVKETQDKKMNGLGCIKSEVEFGLNYDFDGKVLNVKPGKIADLKGFKVGMTIISINGRLVKGDPLTIPIEINGKQKGDQVKIEYLDLKSKLNKILVTLE